MNIYILGGIVATCLVVSAIGISAISTISKLQASNTKLSITVKEQQQTLDQVTQRYKNQADSLISLMRSNEQLGAEKQALSDKLLKHDLEELSKRKPALVEKRINDGTQNLFDSFSAISTN